MDKNKYSLFTYEAVLSRIRRGRLQGVFSGQQLLAADVEPAVAQLCIRASQSNHSISQEKVVAMVNSLLKGSECEKEIIRWKLNHCKGMKDQTGVVAKLGDPWFCGFIKRFRELKIAKQCDVNMNRNSWCTYHNLRDMHDILF